MFQISIKQGNLILAVLTDVLLGYVLLQMLPENTGDIRSYLMDMLEVNMLSTNMKKATTREVKNIVFRCPE